MFRPFGSAIKRKIWLFVFAANIGTLMKNIPGMETTTPARIEIMSLLFLLIFTRSGWSLGITGGLNVAGLDKRIFLV